MTHRWIKFIVFFFYVALVGASDGNSKEVDYHHRIKSISSDCYEVSFEDGMSFTIKWWYSSLPRNWEAGDQLYVTLDGSSGQWKLEHLERKEIAWAEINKFPSSFLIHEIFKKMGHEDCYSLLALQNGDAFRSNTPEGFRHWKADETIVLFEDAENSYMMWNSDQKKIVHCRKAGKLSKKLKRQIEIPNILHLEEQLNSKVLQQPEAARMVVNALLRYTTGLKEKEKPVGVFLFLGPTGVGKTEFAKVLTEEIYGNSSQMLRFDMSHFSEYGGVYRLIGSPIDREKAGQLTGPLKKNPQTLVLLDEFEKADPDARKVFLPVFDEGYIFDAKNERIACSDTVFILTSNLCGDEIARLYNRGYSTEEILEAIEPTLMSKLSPELYNRVHPIVFRPLERETMLALVDLQLNKIKERLLKEQNLELQIDESLKNFLAENGYHPLLGARPLKKLIDEKVLTPLSYQIARNELEEGSIVTLSYEESTSSIVEAKKKRKEQKPVEIQDIFQLEDRLNAKVLQQPEAARTVTEALFHYTAGLKEKQKPIGVFLFLGPTGVGKTELAKVLTGEIYQDPSQMLRFDMSHFASYGGVSRLIGPPPGYMDHRQGGQLTNPLGKNSQTIVLLDEIEKAHPQVLKFFLPVFDEGYILDANNKRVPCTETIFILTSNLCGEEIAKLYRRGYSTERILELIEPTLMNKLSPELYNRVQPILFKPLEKETMLALVDLMLKNTKETLLKDKNIQLHIDDSLKAYLAENGYHPLLGARPLKKLIEKKVLTTLSYHLIRDQITYGSSITLFYDQTTDSITFKQG